MDTENRSDRRHNKWIAGAVWLALLGTLIYTSSAGLNLSFGGTLSNYVRFLANPLTTAGDQNAGTTFLAVGGLVVTVVFVVLILNAWLKFASLTHQMIISYAAADRPQGGDSIFYDMLDFEPDAAEDTDSEANNGVTAEPDPARSESSSVSDVIRGIAFTWAVVLLALPVISIATMIFVKPTP